METFAYYSSLIAGVVIEWLLVVNFILFARYWLKATFEVRKQRQEELKNIQETRAKLEALLGLPYKKLMNMTRKELANHMSNSSGEAKEEK